MSSFTWWIALNKIANFAMVVAVCWYATKKYLHPFIKKTLDSRLLFTIELQNFIQSQKDENTALVESAKRQEVHAQTLLAKMDRWNQVIAQRNAQYQKEAIAQEQRCLVYLQKRADGLCQERLKKETFARVFRKTHDQVSEYFEDQQKHAAYVKTLLTGLKKGAHRG